MKQTNLKARLDEIDKTICQEVHNGFYESRLRILIGEWEKGEVIVGAFRGVNAPPSWRELERQTGRGHKALKSWHDLYQEWPDKQKYIKEYAESKAEEWTKAAIENPKKKLPIVSLFTGNEEYFTPEKYVESARKVMGDIDLDPASCNEANRVVKAKIFFTKEDDGLSKEWAGNVFLNPPYDHPLVENFIDKLISSKRVSQAVLLTNNSSDTTWFHNAAKSCSAMCFTKGRINFYNKDSVLSSPTNGQTFFYFGNRKEAFIKEFGKFGILMEVIR